MTLRIDVWSDIACPWCYVGKRRLEAALAQSSDGGDVRVVWRAFELDPSAPRQHDASGSYAERLAKKYGTTVPEAQRRLEQMTRTAREDGLDFHFERVRSGNTFDAHRVLHLALERGKQDAVKERFLLGYMSEGAPIGDPETLVKLAAEAGLDAEEVRSSLATDAFAEVVRAVEREAHEFGISGVPFFVVGGRYAVSGAQPAEVLVGAIARARADLAAEPGPAAEGASCGPGGC